MIVDDDMILYALTVEDLKNISNELNISFTKNDLEFIKDKIGNYLANCWSEAIEYALNELRKS